MTPAPIAPIVGALTTQISSAVPIIASVFGAIFGLVFLVAVGHFIIKRIRGTVA